MQFTIRTLLFVTLIVGLFCSAAVTFQGIMRLYVLVTMAWIVSGGIYLKYKYIRSAIIPHILGPIMALMFWLLYIMQKDLLWSDRFDILPKIILIGLFVRIIVGTAYAFLLRIRQAIK